MRTSRIISIDTFRVIAIFAVILLHGRALADIETYRYFGCAIKNLCRFAVPFFFITSGYFFTKSLRKGIPLFKLTFNYCKRLFIIFIAWSFIYGVLPPHIFEIIGEHGIIQGLHSVIGYSENTLQKILAQPLEFCLEGTSTHLWFLIALIIGITILSLCIWLKQEKYLILYSVLLFIIGYLFINQTPLHISFPYSMRTLYYGNGPFYSTFFVIIGWWLARQGKAPSLYFAMFLIIVGCVMRIAEAIYLWKFYINEPTAPFLPNAYSIGIVPLGIGVFLFALASPSFGKYTFLPKIGELVLGIYVSHVLIIDNIPSELFYNSIVLRKVSYPFLVLFISAGFVVLLKRFSFTKWLVS